MHILHKLSFAFLLLIAILATLGYYLAPQDDLEKADAIVAISGDKGERLDSALRLYDEEWAPILIFAGAAEDPRSPSNATVMKRKAVKRGVPSYAILTETDSYNTRENARNVVKILRENDYQRIILVTSPYHQRRANLEFQWQDEALEIINYSAKDDDWRRSQWWISPRGWYLTVSESVKIALTSVQNFVGASS